MLDSNKNDLQAIESKLYVPGMDTYTRHQVGHLKIKNAENLEEFKLMDKSLEDKTENNRYVSKMLLNNNCNR